MMPKSLYDAMPYAYMAFGASITAVMDSPLKYVPAILFISAGMLIFSWRRVSAQKRHQQAAHQHHRSAHKH